ncbi:extracellular solute-binding protein [Martelella radicis]|uniref:Raffinose/stachyose/melibiose transport system substrate-binding protein n=1 Tax=Martelella radicis TaxID=1397476 RepID=A0A7W6KIH0_9HYPH|nr:extracellular solute-binding protein [Martelella radicis]MBB4121919.1 raffinose/stachyose/melibiose transport system substrate-binding protein [Martelella radicis]
MSVNVNFLRGSLLAVAGFAGLAALSVPAEAETVKWLHLEQQPAVVDLWRQIADEYEKAHPDVTIEMQFLENQAFKAKLPTLLQSSEAPSFFYTWGGGVLKAQSETGMLRNIDPALDANGGAWGNSLLSSSVDGMTFDDKVWAAPFKTGVVSFFYNKELFEKAGVDASSIATWSDFMGAVKALKDAGITPIAGGGGDKWPLHFYWGYLAMREAGHDGFMAAKAGENGGFTGEPFINAGKKLAELGELEPFQNGYLGATWNDALAAFGDGRAAIILSFENTAQRQAVDATDGKGLSEDNIGIFPFPTVAGGAGLVTDNMGGINGWAVTANAPDATEGFLEYFTSPDVVRRLVEVSNILPVTKGTQDAVTDPLLKVSADALAKETWHQNFLDQDLGPNVGAVVNDMSVAIVSGATSPEDAAQQIQDTYELDSM